MVVTSKYLAVHFGETDQLQSITEKTVWKNSISLSKDLQCK